LRPIGRIVGRVLIAAGLAYAAGPSPSGRERAQADPSAVVTFVGAGDIANCDHLSPARSTAKLLDSIQGTIFTLGDHAYKRGDAKELHDCYGSTWGRYKDRTRPAIGNHDTRTANGQPYFDYFGERAGPDRRGYYSFDLGAWHIVSLNSEASITRASPQMQWLREDLATHPSECTLAYWHVPLFASGAGAEPGLAQLWRVLYAAGVDVVLNGHVHVYERFAPQDDQGHADPARGIREFIVGTGGGELESIKHPAPNSEVRNDRTFGVLKLTLSPHGYEWEFVPIAGQRFRDRGTSACSPLTVPAG